MEPLDEKFFSWHHEVDKDTDDERVILTFYDIGDPDGEDVLKLQKTQTDQVLNLMDRLNEIINS